MSARRTADAGPGRWEARGEGWGLTWSPEAPHLGGTAEVVAMVEDVLAAGEFVKVTPTGPSVPSVAAEPFAVVGVLAMLGVRPYTLTGDTPRVLGIPPDAVG